MQTASGGAAAGAETEPGGLCALSLDGQPLGPCDGPIAVDGSCDVFNCHDDDCINGHDISNTGGTEADCAEQCCSEEGCKGFDYADGSCWTSTVQHEPSA